VGALLELAERVLDDSTHLFDDHDHRYEAEQLLAHCLKIDADALDDATEVPGATRDRFLALVARRAAGEPFPLLTGRISFFGLDLKVKAGTFLPRPSSEALVARALRLIARRRAPVLVDVCTGTGPIALALAHERPDATVYGTDIAPEGLAVARRNARRLGIANVSFRRGDMYSGLPRALAGRVDLITGHIPYVPPGELDDLPSEVREHEPVFTLSDLSRDGLGLIRRAAREAIDWLEPGGWLLVEVSEDLTARIERIFMRAGLVETGYTMDEDRLSAVVEGQMPKGGIRVRQRPAR
jgi:release factor glutamine methyltransferase